VDFLLEGQDGMCSIFRVRWTVIPRFAPEPWIKCSGCEGLRPFQSSGKTRLNANGRTLDAWLIYKCASCDGTWNRPIFERRNVRDIDPALREALQANDPEWIRAQPFDVDSLRRKSPRIDEFADVDVHKVSLGCVDGDCAALEIELMVPLPTSLRLDRLLATELGLSRSRLLVLHDQAKLRTDPDHKDMLRRRIKHRSRITVDLSGETDRQGMTKAAR
jgi:hypothetical protein